MVLVSYSHRAYIRILTETLFVINTDTHQLSFLSQKPEEDGEQKE